jgi:serine/threonine protein kinase
MSERLLTVVRRILLGLTLVFPPVGWLIVSLFASPDLKPENILLRDMLDDSSVLLADFGFARYVPEDGLKTRCGTVR